MAVTYPLDSSGISPANLITVEIHSVSEGRFRDYYFIVPNCAPFYVDNFSATLTLAGVTTPLHEDVDYSFALPYVTGTRTTGKQMYGAISLHNLDMNGFLSITYQTIGGDQVADRLQVLTVLAEKAYNPRTTIWDVLTGVPNALPPVPHYQDYDDFKGQDAVVGKLAEIVEAIATNSSLTAEKLDEFLSLFQSGNSTKYIRKEGDTMSGPLGLYGPPIAAHHAATKEYVDNSGVTQTLLAQTLTGYVAVGDFNTNLDRKLDKLGGAMLGAIVLPADPQLPGHASTKRYVDEKAQELSLQIQALTQAVQELALATATKVEMDDRIHRVMAYALTNRLINH